jgi:hypothetical protein
MSNLYLVLRRPSKRANQRYIDQKRGNAIAKPGDGQALKATGMKQVKHQQ